MKHRLLYLLALPIAILRAFENCIGDINDEAWALVEEWEGDGDGE